MRNTLLSLLAFFNIFAILEIKAAEDHNIRHENEMKHIDQIEDPEMKVLVCLNLALEKIIAKSNEIGQISRNIAPPNSTVVPGATPASITNPVQRAEYEKAIQENTENIRKFEESRRLKDEAAFVLRKAREIIVNDIKNKRKNAYLTMVAKVELILSI